MIMTIKYLVKVSYDIWTLVVFFLYYILL